MPGVEQIEAAVGKADFQPVAAPARHQIERVRAWHYLVRVVAITAIESGSELARIHHCGAYLADDDAGSKISEASRIGQADTDRERPGDRRHGSIAGAGNVAGLA